MASSNTPTVDTHELAVPEELSARRVRSRMALVIAIVAVVVAVITLVPGLASLRSRFDHAQAGWIAAAIALKVLSGLGYVLVFRAVFCEQMPWRLNLEIGYSELGACAPNLRHKEPSRPHIP